MRAGPVALSVFGGKAFGDFDQVVSLIAFFREWKVRVPFPGIARPERQTEEIHLVACVVVVILPADLCAHCLQQRGNTVSEHGLAPVADSERAGGVGADKLDHDFVPGKRLVQTVACAFVLNTAELVHTPARGNAEIDKAVGCYLDLVDIRRIKFQLRHYLLGNQSRLFFQRAGQQKSHIHRQIPVTRVFGLFHHIFRHPGDFQLLQSIIHSLSYYGFHFRLNSSGFSPIFLTSSYKLY